MGGNDCVDQWRTSPGDSSSIGSGDHTHSIYLTPPIADTNHDGKSPSIDSLTDSTTNSSFATPPFSLSPVGGHGHNTFLGGKCNSFCLVFSVLNFVGNTIDYILFVSFLLIHSKNYSVSNSVPCYILHNNKLFQISQRL